MPSFAIEYFLTSATSEPTMGSAEHVDVTAESKVDAILQVGEQLSNAYPDRPLIIDSRLFNEMKDKGNHQPILDSRLQLQSEAVDLTSSILLHRVID